LSLSSAIVLYESMTKFGNPIGGIQKAGSWATLSIQPSNPPTYQVITNSEDQNSIASSLPINYWTALVIVAGSNG
jgi:hypothetical protein